MTLILLVAGVVFFILIRVPTALAILAPCLIYVVVTGNVTTPTLAGQFIGGIDSFALLAIPLFILVGNLMNTSGATDRLFSWILGSMGHIPGSLGYANIGTSFVFSGMSGAAVADAAGLGVVEVRAMSQQGYPKRFSLGLTAASSAIGPIIPPSIPAVVYASAAGISVGGLFLAGIIPGVLMAVALSLAVFHFNRRNALPRSTRLTMREFGKQTVVALPVLATPVVLLAGIFGGIFTATEAAAVAVAYVVLVMTILYRSLSVRGLVEALSDTAITSVSIMVIIASASAFGYILALEQAPQLIIDRLVTVSGGGAVALLLVIVGLLVIGTFLEPLAAIVILTPVVSPLAQVLDINPIQLGMVVILNLMIGLLTPPVGMVLFSLSSVTKEPVWEAWRGTAPFIVPLLGCSLLVAFVPALTTFPLQIFGLQ